MGKKVNRIVGIRRPRVQLALTVMVITVIVSGLAQTVRAALTINTGNFVSGWTFNRNYSSFVSVTSSNGADRFSWSLETPNGGDEIPPGLAIVGRSPKYEIADLQYLPLDSGVFTFRIVVNQTAGPSSPDNGFVDVTLTINPPLRITSSCPPPWTAGYQYKARLTVTGGTGTKTWSIPSVAPLGAASITLPDTLAGFRATSGTVNFVARVKDQGGDSTDLTCNNWTFNQPLSISESTLPPWSVGGNSYYYQLTATGGTGSASARVWSTTTVNLDSLHLSGAGVISGHPFIANPNLSISVKVQDSIGASYTKTVSIRIYAAPVITTVCPLPSWTRNSPIEYVDTITLQDSALSPVWSIPGGGQPANLTIQAVNQKKGVIKGNVVDAARDYTFAIRVTDGANAMDEQPCGMTVNDFITINPPFFPPITAGAQFCDTLQASGGKPPYTWQALDPLPPNITLTDSVLCGTVVNPNTYSFEIKVTDDAGAIYSKPYQLVVNQPLQITSSLTLTEAVEGISYLDSLTATGGTQLRQWDNPSSKLCDLGICLTSDGTFGIIEGTPAHPDVSSQGHYNIPIVVTDQGKGKDSAMLTLKIDGYPQFTGAATNTLQTIQETGRPAAMVAQDPNGDALRYEIIQGSLPPDLALNTDGTFRDTANYLSAGTYDVRIRVYENDGGPHLLADTTDLHIVVTNRNRPPAFSGDLVNTLQTVQEGGTLSSLLASDPDPGTTLHFTVVSGYGLPDSVTLQANGSFTGRVDFGAAVSSPYTVRIAADDQDSGNHRADTTQLVITVTPDIEPPYVVLPAPSVGGTGQICVNVEDDGAGVKAVTALWRFGNAKTAYRSLPLVLSGGTQWCSSANVPLDSLRNVGLDLRFFLVDKRPDSNATNTTTYSFSFEPDTTVTVVPAAAWLGTIDNSWHLVSFPGRLADASVRSVLNDASGLPANNNAPGDQWRLVRYDTLNGSAQFVPLSSENQANHIREGEGYWFRTLGKVFTLRLEGCQTIPTAAPVQVNLRRGWNLIGNPFFFPLVVHRDSLWEQAQAHDLNGARLADPNDPMTQWAIPMLDTGNIISAKSAQLQPYAGYAIYCEAPSGGSIRLDPHYQPPPGSPAGGPVVWSLPITALVDHAPTGRVSIGVIDAPSQIAQSYDSRPLDMFTRPSAILITDSVRGEFVRKVSPRSSDVQKWILAITPSETGEMSLAWGSQPLPEPGQKLVLRDVLYDRVTDMTSQPVYDVINAAQIPAGRFVIYLGDSAAVMRAASEPTRAIPSTYRLYQNYPNPFNPTTTLAFDLPVFSHVELVIFNILGERVRTLVSEMRPAGSYVIPWNSRDDRGQSVASGVYFARLLAGTQTVTIKMALVK